MYTLENSMKLPNNGLTPDRAVITPDKSMVNYSNRYISKDEMSTLTIIFLVSNNLSGLKT